MGGRGLPRLASATVPIEIDPVFDEMVDTRRWLHQRPELAFEEFETTELIRARLRSLGMEERPLTGPTGAVFRLTGSRPGRPVLLRADIDGLPVTEEADVPFASTTEGRMHACGHDAHVASLLGAARALSARAEDLPGTYTFLFQPAEENLGGARQMIDAGVLDDLSGAAVVGHHIASVVPAGVLGVRPGIAMAEVHSFMVRIKGPGGHGATLGRTGDVVGSLGDAITRLERAVDGLAYEDVACVCSAGLASAGSAPNVVPVRAVLRGTLRTFTEDQRRQGLERLGSMCAALAEERGVDVQFEVVESAPAVVNDPEVTAVVRGVAEATPGATVITIPPITPSDDVSLFLQRLPGCYFLVGAGRSDGTSGAHHSPTFAIDEEAMRIAAGVTANAALALAGDVEGAQGR
jgi:amidohydrolase